MSDSGSCVPDQTPLLRLAIPGTAGAVSAALQGLFAGPERLPLPPDLGRDAQIVLAEAMNNIVEHAYADRAGEIDLTFWAVPGRLICRLTDTGAPMPACPPEPKLPEADETGALPEGGFGRFLIRELAREVVYARIAGHNQLTFCIQAEQLPS